jgi:hypothetical protein
MAGIAMREQLKTLWRGLVALADLIKAINDAIKAIRNWWDDDE